MFYLTLTITHKQGPPTSLFLIKEDSGLRIIGDAPIEIIKTLKTVKDILDALGIPNNNVIDENITGESLAISFVEESLVVTSDNYEQVISQHHHYIEGAIRESELQDLFLTPIVSEGDIEPIESVELPINAPEMPEAPLNIEHQIPRQEEIESTTDISIDEEATLSESIVVEDSESDAPAVDDIDVAMKQVAEEERLDEPEPSISEKSKPKKPKKKI